MSLLNHTYEIFPQDCVGDSAGKHNFNILSLDTLQCNISSKCFEGSTNYATAFNELTAIIPDLIFAAKLYENPFRYNTVYCAVNTLSAYWTRHEFSVTYQVNVSNLQNRSLNAPVQGTGQSTLINLAKSYIDTNFPAAQFLEKTLVNVNLFLYSTNNPDNIQIQKSNEITFMNRTMNYIRYSKPSVHFSCIKVFKFYKNNGRWVYLNTVGDSCPPASPAPSTPNQPPTVVNPGTGTTPVAPVEGSKQFLNCGQYAWTVPSGVNKLKIILIGGGGGGGANCGGGGGGGGVFQQIVNVTPGSTVPITVGCGGSGGDPFTIPRRRLNVKPRAAVGEDGDNGEATVFNNQYSAAGGQGGQGGNLRSDAAGGAAGGGGSAGGSGSDKYYQSTRGGAGVTTGIGVAAGGGTGGFDWDLAQGVTNNNFTNRYNRTTIDAMLTPVAGGGGSATVNGAIFYGPEAGKNGRKINRRPPPGPGNPGSNSIGGGGGGGGGGKNNRTVPPQSGGDGGCGSCHIYWGRDERGVVIT